MLTDSQLIEAFQIIARRAGLLPARPAHADAPHCGCVHPCPMPVLERGALCKACALSPACLRSNHRMALSREWTV